MFAVAGLLLIAAVVFGVLGMRSGRMRRINATRPRAATKRRHDLADQQHSLDGKRSDLEDKLRPCPTATTTSMTPLTALGAAHDHYVDLLAQSVDLYNAGDTPGSVAVLTNDGAAAIADLQAKKAATQQAVQEADDALHRIQEGL